MITLVEENDLVDKIMALCWDAELIQRSATEKSLFRMLPPSPIDNALAESLGIQIIYNPIPNPVTILLN